MIDMFIKDMVLEMTEAKAEEEAAQKEYEQPIADKEQVLADTEVQFEKFKAAGLAAFKELQATLEYISALHADCDWLLQNFKIRKEARAGEAEALKNAKAVLSGASYSLLETGTRHHFLHPFRK